MRQPPEGRAAREALARWFVGLLIGGIAGTAPLVLGTVGLLLAAPVVLWALIDRPRGVVLGGTLVGVGAAWSLVWGRAVRECVSPGSATDGCVGPDVGGLIAVPIIVLACGGLVSLAAARHLARWIPRSAERPFRDEP